MRTEQQLIKASTKIDKKPVAPILDILEVNESTEYPLSRLSTIQSSILRTATRTGKKFSYSTATGVITVTRIK